MANVVKFDCVVFEIREQRDRSKQTDRQTDIGLLITIFCTVVEFKPFKAAEAQANLQEEQKQEQVT